MSGGLGMINFVRLLTAAIITVYLTSAAADEQTTGMMRLHDDLDESRGMCFDIAGFRENINLDVPMQAHTCKPNPNAREDEVFAMDYPGTGNIHNAAYDVCVDVVAVVERGSVFVRPCSDSETQKFVLAENGELRPAGNEDLCVAASPTPSHPAVRAGRTPEPGVTFVARAMSLAPCDETPDELKLWHVAD